MVRVGRAPLAQKARVLVVDAILRETKDAVTIVLRDPTNGPIDYLPGQFFTVSVRLGERVVRRNYSASRPASGSQLAITVKRVSSGTVSPYLVDQLKVGDELSVEGPSGHFVVRPNPSAARELLLIGGGSGITPLMAIGTSVLSAEPRSSVTLIYGNRSEEDVIFREAIRALEEAYPERFVGRYALERPPPGWGGYSGILNGAALSQLISEKISVTDVYVCGPGPMRQEAKRFLESRGIDPHCIHEERYTLSEHVASEGAAAGIELSVGGRRFEITTRPNETLLEAGLRAKAPMPYSCAMGGCGACRLKLEAGDVVMEEPNCLTPGEKREGYVLTCVGRATSNCVLHE